jgi:purine nucleoside permease
VLPNAANLQQVRAGYPGFPNALRPPFVLEGDDLAADDFWIGDLLNTWAENWFNYWTQRQRSFAMADFGDIAVAQGLQFLSQAGRADQMHSAARTLVDAGPPGPPSFSRAGNGCAGHLLQSRGGLFKSGAARLPIGLVELPQRRLAV